MIVKMILEFISFLFPFFIFSEIFSVFLTKTKITLIHLKNENNQTQIIIHLHLYLKIKLN